jgi:hypothetical protein
LGGGGGDEPNAVLPWLCLCSLPEGKMRGRGKRREEWGRGKSTHKAVVLVGICPCIHQNLGQVSSPLRFRHMVSVDLGSDHLCACACVVWCVRSTQDMRE